ncbi:MAG: DUF4892 domain-containing protein [Pseudomonadota bacterium]
MRPWAAALCAALLAAPAAAGEPAESDLYGVEPFPRSTVVAHERDEEIRPRRVILSRVDRIRRELRIDKSLDVEAALEAVTYRMPEGTSVPDVVRHYRRELGDDVLFRCRGRDCGRSNDWANQVFEQAILYGPDRQQHYEALAREERLVTLYVVERGNRRVYAHLRVLDPPGALAAEDAGTLLAARLSERGWAVVASATPDAGGGFGPEAREALAEAGGALEAFAGQDLYLVCHLGGGRDVDALLAASRLCAQRGSGLILTAVEDTAQPTLHPFGAGPLLPRSGAPASRIELVLPGRTGSGGSAFR